MSYSVSDSAGWGLVELRYESSLLAVSGSGLSSSLSPRTVSLLDARSLRVLSELSFAGGVLDVRLSGERLVCVLQDKVHVFDLRSLQPLYALPAAAAHTRGLSGVAVVPFEQPPSASFAAAAFLAVPSHDARGDASVYSYDGQLLAAVHAHTAPIRMLALSHDGRLMATCSLSGTLIRLFSLPVGTKLLTLRRGTLSSHVNCLTFNQRATRLCVGSRDSTTLHIFNIPAHSHSSQTGAAAAAVPAAAPASAGSWPVASLLRQSVQSLSSLSSFSSLSGRLEDALEPNRGDALIVLKTGNEPLAVSFTAASSPAAASHTSGTADELLHVVTRAGALFSYALRGSRGDSAQPEWHLESRLLSVHFLHSDPVAVQSLPFEPSAAIQK